MMPKTVPVGRIWGPINPEDLALVPGREWVITSGMTGPGALQDRLFAIGRRDYLRAGKFPPAGAGSPFQDTGGICTGPGGGIRPLLP